MRGATSLFVATLLLAACQSEPSPGVGSDSDTTGTVAPPESYQPPACGGTGESFGSAVCAACAETSCCSELEACAPGTPCAALLECRAICFDGACLDACVAAHPDGLSPATAYDACLAGPCADDCPQSPGVCGTTFSTGKPDCDACVGDSCCAPLSACQADPTCAGCLEGYSEACASAEPFSALTACLANSCGGTCDG